MCKNKRYLKFVKNADFFHVNTVKVQVYSGHTYYCNTNKTHISN